MEKPLKGEIIILSFPFTDRSAAKRRPAVVLADLKGNDMILCPITSRAKDDGYAIPLADSDISKGSLDLSSFIRPNILLTADKALMERRIGTLKKTKLEEVIEEVCKILKR